MTDTAATTTDTEITWGAYLRLSRLKSRGRRPARGRYRDPDESVERQLALIRAYAAERGLTLPDHLVFRDNGRSAWWKPGRPRPVRPGWDRMIAAGKAGEFGGLLTWKLDRFARDHYDGQDLIHLGVLLDGPETGRIDPRTNDGQTRLNTKVEAARAYSHEISEKVQAAFTDMLASGYRVGGSGRLFGFEILSQAEIDWDGDGDGDERFTGPAAVVRQDEAEVIRELARRLLAGDTVQSMADDLTARGITTTRGGPWEPRNLSRTLGNPLYGGHLAYKGEIIGTLANVEAILDTETYDAVQDKLGARRRGRKPTGRYPLTGIPVCANPACARKGTMAGVPRDGTRRAYVCAVPGKVRGCGMSVLAEPVEAMVRDAVLAAWADEAMREAMREADTALDDQRAKLRGLLADLDADMADTEAKHAATPRSMARRREQIERNLASMTARYEAAERELGELGEATARPQLPELLSAREWDDPRITTPADRAVVIRQLGLTVKVLPATRAQGSSRLPFDAARVQITGPDK